MKRYLFILISAFLVFQITACGDSFAQGLQDGMNGTQPVTEETEPEVATETVAEPENTEPEVTEPDIATETKQASEPEAVIEQDNIIESSNEIDTTKLEETNQSENNVVEYDALQNVFLELDMDIKPEKLEKLIEESDLSYTTGEYNSSSGKILNYTIAFTEDSALQRYAESGDHLEVVFGGKSKDEFMYAQYVNSKSVSYTALLYNHGTWNSFSNNNAEDYQGYYNNDSLSGNSGIVVKYTNGNEAETNYFPCESGEEAILNIIAKIME